MASQTQSADVIASVEQPAGFRLETRSSEAEAEPGSTRTGRLAELRRVPSKFVLACRMAGGTDLQCVCPALPVSTTVRNGGVGIKNT